jgi:AmiR/NasT family two-component response regulator
MADVAAVAIEQIRLSQERVALIVQLETALESRVAIEQAKGILSSRLDIGLNDAFLLLRQRARNSRRLLRDVAAEVVETKGDDYSANDG